MSHNQYSVIISLNGIAQNPIYIGANEKVREILKRYRQAEGVPNDSIIILSSKALVISEEQSLEEQSIIANEKREYHLLGLVKLSSSVSSGFVTEDIKSIIAKCEAIVSEMQSMKEIHAAQIQKLEYELRRRPRGFVQLMYPGRSVWVLPPTSIRAQTKLAVPQTLIKLSEKWILSKKSTTDVYLCPVNSGIIEHTVQFESPPSANAASSSSGDVGASAVVQPPPEGIPIKVWCVKVMLPSKARINARWGDYADSITEYLAIGGWEYTTFDITQQKDVIMQVRLISDLSVCPIDEEYYCHPAVDAIIPTSDAIKAIPTK